MKDFVKTENELKYSQTFDIVSGLSKHLIIILLGFVCSRATIVWKLCPFGLSFVGGIDRKYTPSAAIGAFFGYFIPAVGEGAFRYIAALLAIIAIKIMLSSYKRLVQNPLFLSLVVFLSSAITSVVALDGSLNSILSNFVFVLTASATTYFVAKSFSAVINAKAGLSGEELSCLLLVCAIIILGFNGVSFFGVSLSKVLSVTLILIASKYGGTLSGAVSGIAVSFTGLLLGESSAVSSIYAFAGLTSGLFSTLGRYAQIAAVIISGLLSLSLGGLTNNSALILAEMLIGCALFLLIPRSAGIILSKLFCSCPKVSNADSLKTAINLKLKLACDALGEVSNTVEQVSKELSKINAPDFSKVITLVEQDACNGCKLRLHCWETKRDQTLEAILKMTQAIRLGNSDPENFASDEFKGRCVRRNSVASAVKSRYLSFASAVSAENRIEEVRGVISDQFSGISYMLNSLSEDISGDERFDNTAALNAASALRNLGILTRESSARIDKFGRLTLNMQIQKKPDAVINRMQIMRLLSLSCERNFGAPVISKVGDDTFLTLTEQPNFKADIGVCQICATKNTMCGDAYSYFHDGKGHIIAILSDGMGTGGRAAVDGAMASGLMSQLLKAGFGFDCALKILNSSMLFKSTDESLATLDIVSVDLFTGETLLLKAGAAPTVVRRSGKVGKAESNSVPVGILRDVKFDSATLRLKEKDIIVLMSDGVCQDNTDWIKDELEKFEDGSAETLAELLSECAERRYGTARKDDITVLTIILEKAVPKI